MTKVLATRIKDVLPSIIHHNETGYIKDRYIGETIRSIFDIMDFTLNKNIYLYRFSKHKSGITFVNVCKP